MSLAAEGLCRRVYGGALPIVTGATPIAARVGENVHRKRSLAGAAVRFIEPGSFVFVDNGSANLALVEALPADLDLTVATSSITIAAVLQHREDIDLLLVGGIVDRMVGGAVDATAIEVVSRLNIDLCLLGACALSVAGGVSAFDMADADFKRTLAGRSRKTIVLATNDKLDQQAPHRIVGVDDLAQIVVEHDADAAIARDLIAAGATVVHAEAQVPGGRV